MDDLAQDTAVPAALSPAAAPSLCLVARNEGGRELSVSLDEHNGAVERHAAASAAPGEVRSSGRPRWLR